MHEERLRFALCDAYFFAKVRKLHQVQKEINKRIATGNTHDYLENCTKVVVMFDEHASQR